MSSQSRDLGTNAIVRIVDAMCEGPIVGLVNGLQSVFFDDTRLQNPDGTFNFNGVTVDTRLGTFDQTHMPGFPQVESEKSVGAKVTKSTPLVRAITDANVDAVRVKIRTPQLFKVASNGQLNANKVEFKIEFQPDGGSYTLSEHNFTWNEVSGSTTSTSAIGIRATVSRTISGLFGSKQTGTLTAEYRAVGGPSWLPLDTRDVEATILTGGPGDTSEETVSATFTLDGLSADDYEVRATEGTLAKLEEKNEKNISIDGKSTAPDEFSYRVGLTGDAPWNIRVTRVTDDSTTENDINDIFWSTYTEIIDAKLQYPDTALAGVTFDAEQFGSNTPKRSYEIDARIIQVPSNYDTRLRTYTGIWDGTFKTDWTNNPAWITYDILVNKRFGLGEDIDASQIDKFAFHTIGQYCDELVDDGFGGQEPRFTFNGVLQTRRDAYEVINAFTSAFRGMAYWGSGAVTVTQDSPADAKKLVSPSNVENGMLDYSGAGLKARATVALVTWNNPALLYKPDVEVVEDQDGIHQFGWRSTEVFAFGCTSRGQAIRFGKWILDVEKNESQTVTYVAGLDHADLRPGDIIDVADDDYAEVRYGGRVISSTPDPPTSITIDQEIEILTGETYTLSVTLPDGTIGEKLMNNSPGTTSVLSLVSALTAKPIDGAMWVITATSVNPRKFRVVTVRKKGHKYEVTAIFHDTTKYARIEQNINAEAPSFTLLPTGPVAAPTDLAAVEFKYQAGIDILVGVTFSWKAGSDSRIRNYEVQVKGPNDEAFLTVGKTTQTSIDFPNTVQGTYALRVTALTQFDSVRSQVAEASFDLLGLFDNPDNVANFSMQVLTDHVYLSWDRVTNLDLSHYRIKHTQETTGVTWGSANLLVDRVSRDATGIAVPAAIGTYLIKAVDVVGVESVDPTTLVTNIGAVLGFNFVETVTEHTTFLGDKVDVVLDGNLIRLSDATKTTGIYTFFNSVDLGRIYTSRLTPNVKAFGTNLTDKVDDWTNVDDILNWDGTDPGTWSIQVEVRHTDDHPELTSVEWSEWKPLIVGDYTARAFQFRIRLNSLESGISPAVEELAVTVDMPDRTIGQNNVTCPTVGLNVTFNPGFKVTPAIGITGKDMATGDFFEVTGESRTGFTVQFKNSAGSGVERVFDWLSVGYGFES